MKFEMLSPDLGELDVVSGDLLALPVFDEDFPPKGLPGLLDWRLRGRISRLLSANYREAAPAVAEAGLKIPGKYNPMMAEQLLMPSAGACGFRWLLLVGAGARKSWDRDRYRTFVEGLVVSLAALKHRRVAIVLPPWIEAGLTVRTAAEILLRSIKESTQGPNEPFDALFVVENVEHQPEFSEAAHYFMNRGDPEGLSL